MIRLKEFSSKDSRYSIIYTLLSLKLAKDLLKVFGTFFKSYFGYYQVTDMGDVSDIFLISVNDNFWSVQEMAAKYVEYLGPALSLGEIKTYLHNTDVATSYNNTDEIAEWMLNLMEDAPSATHHKKEFETQRKDNLLFLKNWRRNEL